MFSLLVSLLCIFSVSTTEPSELPELFKGLQVIRLPPDAPNVQPQLSAGDLL